MKIFLILALPLFINACTILDSVQGSGRIVSENRKVANFSAVELNGSGKLLFTQDTSFAVRVECDDNIISNVETEVKNGTLSIGLKHGSYSNMSLTVHVSAPAVSSFGLSGSGKISSTGNISAGSMHCEISGSGMIALAGKTNVLDVDISGSGNFMGFDLSSQTCTAEISGSGAADLNVSERLQADISGSGKVTYMGNPIVDADVSGSGKVRKK